MGRESTVEFHNNMEMTINLSTPTLVVLFHPEIPRIKRYEPLNFLLAYDAKDPLRGLFQNVQLSEEDKQSIGEELSPLDYFFAFQDCVEGYDMNYLRDISKDSNFPRLGFIKELDFGNIIGQRLAKHVIRQEVVRFIWDRSAEGDDFQKRQQPLSMMFAGPSGVGKTELAMWLAELMNKPNDDAFLKIDCGKLSDEHELFGMAGAYQGAYQGSALNNFILRKSQEPDSIGIVLLDEIEKAERGVIHALYQVIDKGEWTNKKLEKGDGPQTEIVPCDNIIFIMTTSSATQFICDRVKRSHSLYTSNDFDELEAELDDVESLIRKKLQTTYPFTSAFIGRIGRIVPFLPLSNGDNSGDHQLLGESMTVAKMFIEREQEKLTYATRKEINVQQLISPKNKHSMAKLVVASSIPEAGARSIESLLRSKMGNRLKHSLLVARGGISRGSTVRYSASEEANRVDFGVVTPETDDNYNGSVQHNVNNKDKTNVEDGSDNNDL